MTKEIITIDEKLAIPIHNLCEQIVKLCDGILNKDDDIIRMVKAGAINIDLTLKHFSRMLQK